MKHNNILKSCKHVVISTIALFPLLVSAATNGSIGPTSTGTLQVSINVNSQVLVSGFQDYTNNSWDGSPLEFYQNLCVYSNNAGTYRVQVNGTNNEASFQLVNSQDTAHPVPYTVAYQDATKNSYLTLTPGIALSNQQGSTAQDCNGATNAQLKIDVGAATGMSGTYTGTVNVLVMPQ